jgi:hypothetical protein
MADSGSTARIDFADRYGFGGPRNLNPAPGEMSFTLFGYWPSLA